MAPRSSLLTGARCQWLFLSGILCRVPRRPLGRILRRLGRGVLSGVSGGLFSRIRIIGLIITGCRILHSGARLRQGDAVFTHHIPQCIGPKAGSVSRQRWSKICRSCQTRTAPSAVTWVSSSRVVTPISRALAKASGVLSEISANPPRWACRSNVPAGPPG